MSKTTLLGVLFILLPLRLLLGQCNNPSVYFKDEDGDNFGTNNFDTQDINRAILDFNDARDGSTVLYGNIAYGCSKPSGYATVPGDCDDGNKEAHAIVVWFTDEDGDGAFGTKDSGCQKPPIDSSPFSNDCDDTDATVKTLQTFYENIDGDEVGGNPIQACHQGSYLTTGGDCDDEDPNIKSATTWYLDGDDDGVGGPTTRVSCTNPSSSTDTYVEVGGDQCDDDPLKTRKVVWYEDFDRDGYGNSDSIVYSCSKPAGNWATNGDDLDDRNDRITDVREQWYYQDSDRDGYGNPNVSEYTSSPSSGYVTNDDDCDDNDDRAFPGARWYRDQDGDGYGTSNITKTECLRPSGYTSNSGDIDDGNPLITNVPPRNFYEDRDQDSYGNPNVVRYQSFPPLEGTWVTNTNDCNDQDPLLHNFTLWSIDQDGDGFGYNAAFLTQTNSDRGTPNANTPPTGVPANVLGCIDPSTASYTYVLNSTDYDDTLLSISDRKPQWFYPDGDGDNYGTATNTLFQSLKPEGYAPEGGDCNDENPLLHPMTIWFEDADGDTFGNVSSTLVQCEMPSSGYVSNSLDYSDTTTHVTNIKPEFFYRDKDKDLYGNPDEVLFYSYLPQGYVRNNEDCDDTRNDINPKTVWYEDADGDSYGTTSSTLAQCTQPLGYVTNSADFDDSTDNIINIAPQYFYFDGDGDRYGDPDVFVFYSIKPDNYVLNALDCDDSDALINPQKVWFLDADGDGLGTHTVTITSCLQPDGYVDNFEDLGDETKYITNITPVPFFFDADGDGYGDPNKEERYSFAPPNYYITGEDCNDNDARVHPNTLWYFDADGDGYGVEEPTFTGCTPPNRFVLNKADLDDTNRWITDVPGQFYYRDKDNDGYGVDEDPLFQSYPPPEGGYALLSGDCNDNDPQLHPATAWYEDKDNDGHGGAVVYYGCFPSANLTQDHSDLDDNSRNITDIPPRRFYEDADQDGDGNPLESYFGSYAPRGYVPNSRDCDDTRSELHHRTYWFMDSDGDGYGDANQWIQQCEAPSGYVLNGWDYDDTTTQITDIAPRYFYLDSDQDGYGTDIGKVWASFPPADHVSDGGDCDDTDPLLHPETHWFQDFDQDGFGSDTFVMGCESEAGFVLNSEDWDDNEACITDIFPRDFYEDADNDGYGNPDSHLSCSELPEDYVVNDEDCDDNAQGIKPTTLWYLDEDGDGYGVETEVIEQCEMPIGFAPKKGDCDDTDPYLLPSVFEAAVAMGLDPYNQVLLRDCNAPEEEEEEEQENLEGLLFADRDGDTFGDPDEFYTVEEIDLIDFLVVLNADDACPEKFGIYKGCPNPFIIDTELGQMNNQVVRLFVKDTVSEPEEIVEKLTDVQLASLEVYPNPTNGLLTAVWKEDIIGAVQKILIMGYHHSTEFEIPFNGQNKAVTINLTDYPDDLYFVQFYLIDGRFVTKKIIKAKQ